MRPAVFALLLAACGAPDSRPVALPSPPAVGSATVTAVRAPAFSDSPDVRVELTARPANLRIDGDLGEWPANTAPPPRMSAIRVAVTTEGIFLSGELGLASKDGVALVVASPVPKLPAVGQMARGGNVEMIAQCDYETETTCGMGCDTRPTDKKNPPEVAAACHALLDNYKKLGESHARRFAKHFFIDASGVKVRDATGAFVGLEGSKVAWVPKDGSEAFEASIPVAALPRLSEAPVETLSIWAHAGHAGLSDVPPEGATFPLPAPLAFEPHGDVRAAVFAVLAKPHYLGDRYIETPALSYDAADPAHVETMDYTGPSGAPFTVIEPRQDTFFEPKGKLGDVEVGLVTALDHWIVVLKNGKLFDAGHNLIAMDPSETLQGVLERDGELHVVLSMPGRYNPFTGGPDAPRFRVVAVGPSGVARDALVPLEDALFSLCNGMSVGRLDGGTASFDKTFTTLRLRGNCQADGDKNRPIGYEATWRWSPEKKMYTGTAHKAARQR